MAGYGVDRGSGSSSGSPDSKIGVSTVDAKGDLIVGTANDAVDRLAAGNDGERLVADSTQSKGLKYVPDTTNYAIGAKGDLLVGTAADTLAALTVGTNGQALVADSAQTTGVKWSGITSPGQNSLVDYLHIDSDTGHRDLIRGGWMPAFFNQQWGGAPHYFELVDGATGTSYRFEAATGYIQDDSSAGFGDAAASTRRAQGFKVSKSTTLSAVWFKLYKIGNPTDNIQVQILSDDGTGTKPTGSTPITNGTATAISGKTISSDTNGQWVRFVFPTPPSLTAGTVYQIDIKRSGANDGSNYYVPKGSASGKYPHGNLATGDGTPTWTATSTFDLDFLAEIASADESLATGGIFSDGKLTFFEGSPLNQSNGRVKDLRDFQGLDLTDFTLAIFGASWTKDKTILDITYGLDHDRIVLRCNVTTGFAQVDLYDSSGNKKTVTGTVDVSSGSSLLGIRIRAKGDGSDKVELWENGSLAAASLSAQTISFDKLFGLAKIGTMWLGGGWQVTPTWTKDTAMTVLPSSDGWTWTGTGTESACMSVSGGKLYQNKNGYASTDTGYYEKSSLSLSNANGWAAAAKIRASSTTNTTTTQGITIDVYDGTKRLLINLHEYFTQHFDGSAWKSPYPQIDLKNSEHVYAVFGKGSDAFSFVDGKIAYDFTGLLTGATASNQIFFGDQDAAAGENADVVWDYVKYYNTAWLPPQFTAGQLSEFVVFNGDRTSLLATLWNNASPLSVKQTCGMTLNYGPVEVVQRQTVSGITSAPTTTSTSFPPSTVASEMEMFVVGATVDLVKARAWVSNSTDTSSVYVGPTVDGECRDRDVSGVSISGANGNAELPAEVSRQTNFGLHKVDLRWAVSANTGTLTTTRRRMEVQARS